MVSAYHIVVLVVAFVVDDAVIEVAVVDVAVVVVVVADVKGVFCHQSIIQIIILIQNPIYLFLT